MTQISMEDIQHLSNEIRALARARLPLEQHLADAGSGQTRRLQKLSQEIGERLQQGEPLERIVNGHQPGAPRMLAATLAAGVRTGDLATCIELLGDIAAEVLAIRTELTRAMTYPLIVCVTAFVLFAAVIRGTLHQIFDALIETGVDVPPLVWQIIALDARYAFWPWILAGGVLTALLWWLFSGRSGRLTFRGPERILLLIPGVGRVVRDLQFYLLTRMLRLLIVRRLPLPDALNVAGACTGNQDLESACSDEATALRQGTVKLPPPTALWQPGQLPPLLQLAVVRASDNPEELSQRLTGVAGCYLRRIQLGMTWLQHVIPGALLVLLGGGAVLIYSVTVMWPVTQLYQSIGVFR